MRNVFVIHVLVYSGLCTINAVVYPRGTIQAVNQDVITSYSVFDSSDAVILFVVSMLLHINVFSII